MQSFQNFLEMGSYGGYVWPSYALSALVMAALVYTTLRQLRSREQELARRQSEYPSRRSNRKAADAPDAAKLSGDGLKP